MHAPWNSHLVALISAYFDRHPKLIVYLTLMQIGLVVRTLASAHQDIRSSLATTLSNGRPNVRLLSCSSVEAEYGAMANVVAEVMAAQTPSRASHFSASSHFGLL